MMKDKPSDKKANTSFPIPEGMEIPEDAAPGSSFEAMATLEVGEGGVLSLKAVDGFDISAAAPATESEEESQETEPEDMGFVDAVERRATQEMEG
jgi:hypothetical protein